VEDTLGKIACFLRSFDRQGLQYRQLQILNLPFSVNIQNYSGSGNDVHSALARINEELLERKVAAPV
jgi:hypothetical protein